ncbi:hypothetical protein ABZ904_07750 [Streptomyces sp. NPDC046900]
MSAPATETGTETDEQRAAPLSGAALSFCLLKALEAMAGIEPA